MKNIIIIFIIILYSNLFSYSNGVSGYTLKTNSNGCGACHSTHSSPSSLIIVEIIGPDTLILGQTGNYYVRISGGTGLKVGVNIAASSGNLVNIDNNLKILNSELTHPSAKAFSGGSYSFYFRYTPTSLGTSILYSTGMSSKTQWNFSPNKSITVINNLSPVLSSPLNNSTNIPVNTNLLWNNVTGSQHYRVQLSLTADFQNKVIDTITSNTSLQVKNLNQLTQYFWKVAGYDGTNYYWSSIWNFTTGQNCLVFTNTENWNLISIPLTLNNMLVNQVFPDAQSQAYYFDGSYKVTDTLKNGVGYWLKFPDSSNRNLCGNSVQIRTISLKSGWNLIGNFDRNVPVSEVVTIPSGILQSQFYGFQNGYQAVQVLEIGKAYWIKSSQNGVIVLQ